MPGACKTIGWNAVVNDGWGVLDVSQFGCHHFAPHVSANTIGPYRTMANSAGGTYAGAYQELGQSPSDVSQGSVVFGGTPAGGWTGRGLRILRYNDVQPMIITPHERDANCELHIESVSSISDEQQLVAEFEHEFQRKKQICAVLIVSLVTADDIKWTLAGYDDSDVYQVITIDASDRLATELGKSNANRNNIVTLSSSLLGRSYPKGGGLQTNIGNTNRGEELRRYASNEDQGDYVLSHFRRAVRSESGALVQDYYLSTGYPSQEWMGPYYRGSGLIRYPRGIVIGREPHARRVLSANPSRLPLGVYDVGDVILDSTGATLAQRPSERFALGRAWTRNRPLRVGDARIPASPNGFSYVAIVAKESGGRSGVTGETEPIWPTTQGETIVDGTVTWECWGVDAARLTS